MTASIIASIKQELDLIEMVIGNQEKLIVGQEVFKIGLEKLTAQTDKTDSLLGTVVSDHMAFKKQHDTDLAGYLQRLAAAEEKIRQLSAAPVVVPPVVAPVVTQPVVTPPVIPVNTRGTVVTTHFSAYIRWDEVPGAEYYTVLKNGTELTVINGTDTWDLSDQQDTETTYIIQPGSADGKLYESILLKARTGTASVVKSRAVGDLKQLSNVSLKGNTVSGYAFTKTDIGKVISLEATRRVSWYREAPMWSHLFIKDVDSGNNAIVESRTYKNIPLGTPASELVDSVGTRGYFATNNFDILRTELSTATASTLELTGEVYADPSRTEWYVDNIVEKQGNSIGMVRISNPALLVKGNITFGGEDLLGHRENNLIIPYSEWYPYNIFHHKGGMFAWKGNVRGCETVSIMNRTGRVRFKFYQKDIDTVANCQFIYSGTFGRKENYQSGFTNIADSQRGRAVSGKDLIACVDSTLYCAEPFIVRPYTPDSSNIDKVSLTYGKRFLLRNIVINGAAFSKTTIPVDAFIEDLRDGTARITVDRNRFPTFSFYSNVGIWSRLPIIFKSPTTPAGSINSFQNSVGKQVFKINSAYEVLVKTEGDTLSAPLNKPMIYGTVRLIACQDMQPTIPWEGHVLYTSSLVEIEVHNVQLNSLLGFFIRANNSDSYSGFFNQYSISRLSYNPPGKTNPGFDDIKIFGGYVQFAEWPGPPFIQAVVQGFNPTRKGLIYKSQEPLVNNQNGNLLFSVIK